MKLLRNLLWRLVDRENYDFLEWHGLLDKYWSERKLGRIAKQKEPSVIPLYLLAVTWIVIQALYTTGCANEAFYGHQSPLYPTITTKIEPLTKAELAEDAKRERQPLNRLGGFLVKLLP